MTVARSVADVLDEHVVFEVESIDRMYLNVWQPRLAYGGGVQGFFVGHRGYHYASTALMDPMTKAFVADIHGFVAARGLDLVSFAKGQPGFFMGVAGEGLNYSLVISIMVCLFVGRVVVRLSRRCAGFHAPAGVLS